MKRSALVIYIVMIIVGIIGLFFYINQTRAPVPLQVKAQDKTPEETITVVVARRDLTAKAVLQADDFQVKKLTIPAGSGEAQFNINGVTPINWGLNSAVSVDTYIPPSALIEPGSDDYLSMFLQPGNVLYTCTLGASDNYLLANLKPGQGIDIYLSYSMQPGPNGSVQIVSPADSIRDSRMKPLMVNKRVLAIRPAKTIQKNGVDVVEQGSQLIVELADREVKMLKGLEGKAQIYLFPSVPAVQTEKPTVDSVLPRSELFWPVSEDAIFAEPKPKAAVVEVNELRG